MAFATPLLDNIAHSPGAAERRMRAHIDRLLSGTVAFIDRMNDRS